MLFYGARQTNAKVHLEKQTCKPSQKNNKKEKLTRETNPNRH